MALPRRHCVGVLILAGVFGIGLVLVRVRMASAQEPTRPAVAIPSADEVADLVRREPFSLESWPAWRGRLLAWIGDRGNQSQAAYDAARAFLKSRVNASGELPASLARDALAWYFLGSAYLYDIPPGANRSVAAQAERALRRSISLDPRFARAHRNLGIALLLQDDWGGPRSPEAQQELDEAHRLEPSLPLKGIQAEAAFRRERFDEAEGLYRQALSETPDTVNWAQGLARVIVANRSRSGPRSEPIARLLDRFPNDGVLVCLHALALAEENQMRAASHELDHARSLGMDPAHVLSPELVSKIESEAAPAVLVERVAWSLAGFAAFYLVVMALMALTGVILASRTRGSQALDLLGTRPETLVAAGQVVRTRHETGLTNLYGLALFGGLILFYVAIPFIIAGLLAGTGLLLYLIFQAPRIPIKLVVLIVVVGLGGAWAVFKSLFASPGKGSFGVSKTSEECPRLHQVLTEVAGRVDTTPVHEVYLAPGSSIGVHQEGRGPFGVFGVKRRVLTLGVSTLRFLTVSELQAILAHEYAHFSHKDTFYSRFIYQVDLSIQQAVQGMGASGGNLNYVNPFYWFLVLYYKSYTLLSAGFSRSREFLADRMACSLYGSDVFTSALTKVCTDGSLFEMTIYDNIAQLLGEGKTFVNMYDAFRSFRDEQLGAQDREQLYQKLLDEKGSLFASHPTFGERMEAVKVLPKADRPDTSPALSLLENAEEIEKEMTEFLTGYIHYIQQMQAQAAQAQ